MLDNLQEMIMSTKLTKKEKLVAEFIMDNISECCLLTSTDIAERLSISHSSVVRFARSLGFSGYSDFQKHLRQNYTAQIKSLPDHITVPVERLKKSLEYHDSSDTTQILFGNVLKNIQSAIVNNPTKALDKVCDILLESNNKYIFGTRGKSGIAEFLTLILNQMIANVYNASVSGLTPYDFLSNITDKDCIIIVSLPRYSKIEKLMAEMAAETGAKIIIITDKATAPLAQYASVLLTSNVTSNTFYNSYTSTMFLAEMITSHMSKRIGNDNEKKLKKIDKYVSQVEWY